MIRGEMLFMRTTDINGEKYVNLLEKELELHINIHSCKMFMHDGVQWHRNKVVKKSFD